jgi:uncharacterized phiE125 gp8 family phage protein
MNQFLNRRAGKSNTTDPIVAPVTQQELMDWLVLPLADPTLAQLLTAATGSVIRFLGLDLLERGWTLTHWDWPTSGTAALPTLSRQNGGPLREIVLPYANLLAVSSVEVYGEAVTNFIQRADSIVLEPLDVTLSATGTNTDPALVVAYSAGYGATNADVPSDIKQAILQLAAFNYEHRGSCDATQALTKSGARELLQPYQSAANLVLY